MRGNSYRPFSNNPNQQMIFMIRSRILKLAYCSLLVYSILANHSSSLHASDVSTKYAPPENKVLVFVGQDNESVGGTAKNTDGYVDNIGVPAGITHYIYFVEGWTNKCDYTFQHDTVDGLNSEANWGAGPMNMKAYAESPKLEECIFHISISMEGNSEDRIANGDCDHLIEELVGFLEKHNERVFLIRIGYEFDGSWNNYDPENFKNAYRRIVDHLQAASLNNFSTVLASSGMEQLDAWQDYWPGEEYVDWIGYSYWKTGDGEKALDFARQKGKPVFVAESTPRRMFIDKMEGKQAWEVWYRDYFEHIENNLDVIRAISYINCNWDVQPMWDNWGNSRLERNDYVRNLWITKMSDPTYINAIDNPLDLTD